MRSVRARLRGYKRDMSQLSTQARKTIGASLCALALLCMAGTAHAGIVKVPTTTIANLKAFTSHHPNGGYREVLVVTPDSGPDCNGKSSYALDVSGGRNQVAAAVLEAALLKRSGVYMEVRDDATLAGGRCQITLVMQR